MKYKKLIDPENRIVFGGMFLLMLVLWFSWFMMCENDPGQLTFPPYFRYAGLLFFISGILLFIVPVFQLRGLENINHLVTTGIFSLIRHPMYTGMILWVIGYPLFLGARYTLLTSVIWAGNILFWRSIEEKEMTKRYSEYAAYKKRTLF